MGGFVARYKLLLDESGNFDSLIERYIIIGGLFFCEDDQEQLEKIFIPLHQHLCEVLKKPELHGSENKELYNYVAPIIGSLETIHSVVFVIDKHKTFIFRKYDKKSFKYNKAIEHLIQKMIDDKLITYNDELIIKIDNINLNENELNNLNDYLPSKYSFVKKVTQEDSKDNICIQLSDLIVNRFSKKNFCKPSSTAIKLLNPKIYCFLSETFDDYIKE